VGDVSVCDAVDRDRRSAGCHWRRSASLHATETARGAWIILAVVARLLICLGFFYWISFSQPHHRILRTGRKIMLSRAIILSRHGGSDRGSDLVDPAVEAFDGAAANAELSGLSDGAGGADKAVG